MYGMFAFIYHEQKQLNLGQHIMPQDPMGLLDLIMDILCQYLP